MTPAAVLIFRFNNPDALLTLLLVAAAYATLRAVERGGTRWLLLAATLVGFGFLTKMLQAFLVLPALTAVWLLAAPVGWGRRLRDLALAAVALVVSAGWWVLVVELWPAADRPYIGGSQANSVLELVFGYNGFGRLTGDEVGSVGGSPGGGWGSTGLTRLFGSEFGGQAAWLLPAALLALGALLWWTRRAPRGRRAAGRGVVWGGWLVVTGLTFSLMAGIIHPYYVGGAGPADRRARRARRGGGVAGPGSAVGRLLLAGGVAVTAAWAFVLLRRTPSWQPWLAWTVLGLGVVAVVGLLVAGRAPRVLGAAVLAVAVAAGLAGPTGYAIATAATPHTGAIPSAGPSGRWARRSGRRPGGGRRRRAAAGGRPQVQRAGHRRPAGGARRRARRVAARRRRDGGRRMGGGRAGAASAACSAAARRRRPRRSLRSCSATRATSPGPRRPSARTPPRATSSRRELPVMAVGGFNGTDPSPTLAQFQELVAAKKIHWFVGGAGSDRAQSGGSDAAAAIAAWVRQHYTATTVGGTTLYDLSGAERHEHPGRHPQQTHRSSTRTRQRAPTSLSP